jgi:diamine N-acetyltransferase
MEPEDLDLLYRIENDRRLWNVGTTNVPYSRYVLHDYIANASGDIYTDREVRFIIDNGVGETVGTIDITNFDAKNLRAEVGIVTLSEHRRHGYALAALLQITDYALHVLHLHQLYAFVDSRNDGSRKLFLKAGYQESVSISDWLYDGIEYHDAIMMQLVF